jgi:hypothetical protein
MNIRHRPIFETQEVIEHYSNKDGVDIKYVCTSAINDGTQAMDIFYRETTHPEFGNHYFGLYYGVDGLVYITNADAVESVRFDMVEVSGKLHYSQHRHDYYTIGDVSIDGGRSYLRIAGNLGYPTKTFIVRDGNFCEDV